VLLDSVKRLVTFPFGGCGDAVASLRKGHDFSGPGGLPAEIGVSSAMRSGLASLSVFTPLQATESG